MMLDFLSIPIIFILMTLKEVRPLLRHSIVVEQAKIVA